MNNSKVILILLLTSIAAQARVSLLPSPEAVAPSVETINPVSKPEKQPQSSSKKMQPASGNLPGEYSAGKSPQNAEGGVILPAKSVGLHFSALKLGEVMEAEVLESVIAFSDSKAPVRAVIPRGALKGSILLGEATLEKDSKRILLGFTRFRRPAEEIVYQLSASALDQEGVLGLEGELHSGEPTYFAAEMLSAAAAGYADSTVDRSQNVLGNYVDNPSFSNSSKKALTTALGKSADRFSEKLKAVPEYAVLKGPIKIKVLITDELKTN